MTDKIWRINRRKGWGFPLNQQFYWKNIKARIIYPYPWEHRGEDLHGMPPPPCEDGECRNSFWQSTASVSQAVRWHELNSFRKDSRSRFQSTVILLRKLGCWREGSVVKNTRCSCRGSRFSSQHPHPQSQQVWCPLLTGTWHTRRTYLHAGKTLTHKKINKSKQN